MRDEVERLNAEIRILQGSEQHPCAVSQSVMLEIMKQRQYTMAVAKVKMDAFMTIGSLTGLHPSRDLSLEKDTAFPAWLRHVEADL